MLKSIHSSLIYFLSGVLCGFLSLIIWMVILFPASIAFEMGEYVFVSLFEGRAYHYWYLFNFTTLFLLFVIFESIKILSILDLSSDEHLKEREYLVFSFGLGLIVFGVCVFILHTDWFNAFYIEHTGSFFKYHYVFSIIVLFFGDAISMNSIRISLIMEKWVTFSRCFSFIYSLAIKVILLLFFGYSGWSISDKPLLTFSLTMFLFALALAWFCFQFVAFRQRARGESQASQSG